MELCLDAIGRPDRHALSCQPCRLPGHHHRLLAAKAAAELGHVRVRRAAAVNARLAVWLSEALHAGGHHDCVSLETPLPSLPHFTAVSVTMPSRWGVNHANGVTGAGEKVGKQYERMKQRTKSAVRPMCTHVSESRVTREERAKKDHVKDLLCCCAGPISRKESCLAASRRRRKKAPTRPATWRHPRISRGPA